MTKAMGKYCGSGIGRIVKMMTVALMMVLLLQEVAVASNINGISSSSSSLDVKALYSRICAKYCVFDCAHAIHDYVPARYLECAFGCMENCISWFEQYP